MTIPSPSSLHVFVDTFTNTNNNAEFKKTKKCTKGVINDMIEKYIGCCIHFCIELHNMKSSQQHG